MLLVSLVVYLLPLLWHVNGMGLFELMHIKKDGSIISEAAAKTIVCYLLLSKYLLIFIV